MTPESPIGGGEPTPVKQPEREASFSHKKISAAGRLIAKLAAGGDKLIIGKDEGRLLRDFGFPLDYYSSATPQELHAALSEKVDRARAVQQGRGPEPAPAPESDQAPEPEPEPEPEPGPVAGVAAARRSYSAPDVHPEQLPLDVETARAAYIKAHEDYQQKNPWQAGSILNITGDTSETEAARAAYDAALKAAAERERGEDFSTRPAEEKAQTNKRIFEKLIVDEEKKLAPVREANLPPEEKKWYDEAWSWYAKQPRWKKVAISVAAGTGVAFASSAGASAAILYYAGRRVSALGASALAGAGATAGLEAWDKTFGKKQTVEYKKNAFIEGQGEQNVSDLLDDLRLGYDDILRQAADREKNRAYFKMAVAVAAGAGVTMGEAWAMGGHIPAGADHVDSHAPASHVQTAPIESHIAEVHKGDSLWRITSNELSKDEAFRNLDDAQKTYVISSLTNQEIASHVAGAGSPDQLAIGTHVDLSRIFNDEQHIAQVMDHARHLTPAQEANILANNRAISGWLHAHPQEHMTGDRVAQIIHDREHPVAVENPPALSHLNHPDIGTEPASLSAATVHEGMSGPVSAHDVASMLPHEQSAAFLAPEGLARAVTDWHRDAAGGTQLFETLHRHVDAMTPDQAKQLLTATAEKVGDHHPMSVNMADAAAVQNRMHDYLVTYPPVHEIGFPNYDSWAAVRDASVKRFVDETTVAPRPDAIHGALSHSFWHRGTRVHEVVGGKLHKVHLEPRHLFLGRALRSAGGGSVPKAMTVGEFMGQHPDVINSESINAVDQLKEMIENGKAK